MTPEQVAAEVSPWTGDPCPTCNGYIGRHYGCNPPWRPPVDGETSKEARARRALNKADRDAWQLYWDARCDRCGQVRMHVSHEMDPDNSPEGPEYHRRVEHHQFAQAEPTR